MPPNLDTSLILAIVPEYQYAILCLNQGDVPYYDDKEQSEDCLYLNVWRPWGTSPSSRLPVMVVIHGGGWGLAGSPDPPLWGHVLARDEYVLVVSVSYRLGIFGFLATDEDGSNGMNALGDMVNALEWVNRHISHFGGDPGAVTLVGQGVGAASVCYLSVAPSARGLFRRGAMQSGECVAGGDRPGAVGRLLSAEEGYGVTLDVLASLGAASVEDLADRDEYPAEEIAAALWVEGPVLDRTVLPDYPS